MATFEAQVEGLTSLSIDGSSAPNQTELTQFLTDGAKEVLNALPLPKELLFTTATSLNGSSANLTIGGSEVFTVTRDDGTINQPCRMIPSNMSGRASDSDDMNAATATDPVYYINNNILSVIPEPTNSNNAQVQTLAYPSVAYGDSSITKFPDEAEYLVPLYASVKSIQNLLGTKNTNSDIETALGLINTQVDSAVTTLSSATTALGNANTRIATAKSEIDLAKVEVAEIATQTDNSSDFATALTAINTELDKVDEIILLAHEEFDEVAAEVSSTATSPITQARAAVPSALNISDLTISVSAPSAPSLGTVSYSDASNADASAQAVGAITVASVSKADISGDVPTYTKPSLTTRVAFKAFYADTSNANPFGDNDPSTFSISADLPVAPAINTVNYTDASNADASAQAITSATATAPSIVDVSGNAPEFTKPVVSLDFAKVTSHIDDDEDVELAQAKISQLQAQISEYSANINNEQNEFNKENVRYQMEFKEASEKANQDLQVAIANLNASAQELRQEAQQTTDVDKFNKAQDQALDLANKAKAMEKLVSDNNSKLQKYSNELQSYQAEVNKEIQEYSRNLDKYNTEIGQVFQAWSKTESDSLQQYSLDIQNELNEYNKENVRYQANIQAELAKHNSDLQKALNQARIDADDAKQEAAQTTDIDKFNKQQDQVLALQNKAKSLEATVANNDDLIAKFNSEINKYSAQVNDEVQEYQANIQQKVQELESSIKIQSSYYQEAQARVNAGNAFLQQAQASIAQATGYANEVNARQTFTGAKAQAVQGYINTANAYLAEVSQDINLAQGYMSSVNGYLQSAQGYASEAQVRLTVDSVYYAWYEKQQAKLQADYDKGLQILIGQGG